MLYNIIFEVNSHYETHTEVVSINKPASEVKKSYIKGVQLCGTAIKREGIGKYTEDITILSQGNKGVILDKDSYLKLNQYLDMGLFLMPIEEEMLLNGVEIEVCVECLIDYDYCDCEHETDFKVSKVQREEEVMKREVARLYMEIAKLGDSSLEYKLDESNVVRL